MTANANARGWRLAMFRRTVVFVVLVGCACAARAEDKDPVLEKLFKAKETYDTEIQQVRKAVKDGLDQREAAARKAGDKKALDQIKEDRQIFEDDELPRSAPAALRQRQERAVKALETAYADAVKAYTKAKKDKEAASVEEAWKAFATKANAINLLALVDPKTHVNTGEWKKEGQTFVATARDKGFRLQLPYEPGEEYDVEVTVRRVAGDEGFAVALVAGGRQVCAMIDGWPGFGYCSGVDQIDKKPAHQNETAVKGALLKSDTTHTLTHSVRSGKIDLAVDGKVVTSFKGEFTRLSVDETFGVPTKKVLYLLIAPKTTYQIDRAVVRPVKGKGTILK